jgi:hypothetical protein
VSEPRQRTTDRLAVVLLASAEPAAVLGHLGRQLDAAGANDLVRARLVDTISGLIRLDGVNLAIAADAAELPGLSRVVPSGFDLMTTDAPVTSPSAIAGTVRALLDRRFARVVAILPGSVPLPARIVATALAVGASVDLTIGGMPGGRCYLVGARDHQSATAIGEGEELSVAAVRLIAEQRGLTVGLAEPRRLLDDFSDLDALRVFVETNTELCPEMWHWFSSNAAAVSGSST